MTEKFPLGVHPVPIWHIMPSGDFRRFIICTCNVFLS